MSYSSSVKFVVHIPFNLAVEYAEISSKRGIRSINVQEAVIERKFTSKRFIDRMKWMKGKQDD